MPSVRFIEPSFTRKNPSTNGLVDVAYELVNRGWSIEVFSNALEPELVGKVTHRRAPHINLPVLVSAWGYFVYYHWQAAMDWLHGRPTPDITVSTGFMYLPADLATVHFSHFDFLKASWQRGRKQHGFARNCFLMTSGILSEILFLWSPWKTRLLSVSESVTKDMARYGASWKTVCSLPNFADTERFNPTYRERMREEARQTYGFKDDETVFLFASAGHHFRKGFRQAVETISELRKSGLRVRMLLVGGHERTLTRIRRQLQTAYSDSENWIHFAGSVSNPEFHFSAADGLFFPSLSEAFSLVEIEAAALGLPLYLTAHHGAEMILKDGENGRLLPWDVDGMANLLENEIRNSSIQFTPGRTGKALSKEAYLQAWLDQLLPLVDSSSPVPSEKKPRLMLIGHTYGLEVNREKALQLAEHFEVCVCTCDLAGWKVLGNEVVDSNSMAHQAAYQLRRLERWPYWQDYTKIAFRGLGSELREFRPDIILVENEPWSLLRWQVRVESWLAAPRARFVEFTWENVTRPGFKGWLVKLFYQAAAITGGQVICGNRAARDLCVGAGFPEDQATVAGQLGINPKDHPLGSAGERSAWREHRGWPVNAKVLGFCGRFVEEKGLIELAEACAALRPKYPELRLALVGEGVLRPELEAFDPTGEWLKILPAVRHEEIPAFLNKLDLFVLPSKPLRSQDGQVWEEQFGHVLIEAMACGVLTLGSDSGAIPEVLDDPSVTFRHGSVSDLTAIIDHWLSHDIQREAKAREQREICGTRWTHAAVAQTYAAFLNPDGLKPTSSPTPLS